MRRALVLSICALLAIAQGSVAAPKKAAEELVLDVSSVNVSVTVAKQGKILTIKADGHVGTPGWTLPQLRLISTTGNTLVYNFVAIRPAGPVPQVVTPISATTTWSGSETINKVRVKAKTNEKEANVPVEEKKGGTGKGSSN